jgi:hypothetical protein
MAPAGDAVTRVVTAEVTNPGVGTVDLAIRMKIENRGSDTIYYHPCGTRLENEQLTGTWEQVWSQACQLDAPADPLARARTIPPGDDLDVVVSVRAYSAESGWPASGLGGQYRLHVMLTDRSIRFLPAGMLLSNEFELQ